MISGSFLGVYLLMKLCYYAARYKYVTKHKLHIRDH